jgi:hypothetical protein
MNGAALDRITNALLGALASGQTIEPEALTFLLRRYSTSERADVGSALEPALAEAVDRAAVARTTHARVAWLALFSEASRLSDDERLRATSADLADGLRHRWGHSVTVEEAAESVDGWLANWLRQSETDADPDGAAGDNPSDASLSEAIDELERVVAAAYRPGEGLQGCGEDGAGVQGRLIDHIRTSSALLTAFGVTGRLPYSMLAEELVQFTRRTLWNDRVAAFCDAGLDQHNSLLLNCDAVRVLCRLAALHGKPEYQKAAVLVTGADYRELAFRILTTVGDSHESDPLLSAAFALALDDWLVSR